MASSSPKQLQLLSFDALRPQTVAAPLAAFAAALLPVLHSSAWLRERGAMFTDGMSRLAVAVSVTVALSLAVFLTILVLLLADFFCAHLRRRRLRRADEQASQSKLGPLSLSPARTEDGSSVATTTTAALSGMPPFYYAHGVLHAPNNTKDLLLAIPKLQSAVWRWSPARRSSSPPSRSGGSSTGSSSARGGDGFMCISNPVYDRNGAQAPAAGGDTPLFETPGASPAPFGITEEDDEEEGGFSPRLSAMQKLPPLGVVAYPPPAMSFADARPALTVADTNRASSSSSNLTCHYFFSSWSSK